MELDLLYYLAGVPLLGVLAQWLAWRLRLPAILLLLAFGIILGFFVRPDQMLADLTGSDLSVESKLLFPLVSLSVAIILFEGGLTLELKELKTFGGVVARLVTVGALVSWVLTAVGARLVLGLDLRMAVLLGAILVVTGPTVVAPLLRHIRPARRIGSIAKWEGIVIDPIGALLAVLVFEEFMFSGGEHTLGNATALIVKTAAVGGLLGAAAAWLLAQCLKRYWLPDFLHGVAFLTVALGAFAISNWLQHESGLFTVTLLGVILANTKGIRVHHVLEFKEHLGVLLISCLFIVLGSRVKLEDLLAVGPRGFVFLVVLILLIRPAAVFVSTLRSELSWRERVFLAFLAPRGIVAAAVASVFALKMGSLGQADEQLALQSAQLVPLTFFVIVGTVSVYGLLSGPLARLLQLADPDPQGILFAGAEPWTCEIAKAIQNEGFAVLMVDTNYPNVAGAKMAGLPTECYSILSEHVHDELDLSGIGRMLAMTPNNEVNTMAVREFSPAFGRANVYQLALRDDGSSRRASVAQHLRGRLLFDQQLHHDELAGRLNTSWEIKKTQLTETFSLAEFRAMYGPAAVLLFVIDDNRRLQICTMDNGIDPKAGSTIIALVQAPPRKTNT